MYYVHLIVVGLFQSVGFSSQMSIFLNQFVCHKRFPLSPTKICLLWEQSLLKHKDDIEFKNANDVVTERTPSCVVHLDILKSTDCIVSHGCGSRKWIMLRNCQRWACKDSPTSFTPLLLLLHFAFVLLKYVFLWEKTIWRVWSLGSGMISEALWAFSLLLCALLFPTYVGGCTTDALQVQRRADSRSQALWPGGFCTTFPQKLCQFGWLFSKHTAWKRQFLFDVLSLLLVTCNLPCPFRDINPGSFHQHVLGLLVNSSITDVRINGLLLMQLKVPPIRLALLLANITEWLRSSSRGYQVSSWASHGSQGPRQPDFPSRKNKERRHGICPVSSLIYCRITHVRHSQIALQQDTCTPK